LIDLINETEALLKKYEYNYDDVDESDLYEHSFSDAKFWEEYLGIIVT
jgi:hypothetical protein